MLTISGGEKRRPWAAGLGQEQASFPQFAQELARVDPILPHQSA